MGDVCFGWKSGGLSSDSNKRGHMLIDTHQQLPRPFRHNIGYARKEKDVFVTKLFVKEVINIHIYLPLPSATYWLRPQWVNTHQPHQRHAGYAHKG